jgi:tetratricopeptide (TPR) repeat protein
MLKPKKKITKREIKEDKLVTMYFELRRWGEANRKRLSSALFGIGILAAVTWFYLNNRAADNLNATSDLGKVMQIYDQGKYDLAVKGVPQDNIRGLEQIVNDYGSTPSGELAKLYLGDCYYAQGEIDKAMATYKSADISDKSLQASVQAGIAACYEAKGEHGEAAAYYERAASDDSQQLHTAENLYHAAENYALAGSKEKATDLLKRLKKDFPLSSFAREADRLSPMIQS